MVTRNPNAAGALPREERDAWLGFYKVAQLSLLHGQHIPLSVPGAVHLCTEFAWQSLDAYRKASKGERS